MKIKEWKMEAAGILVFMFIVFEIFFYKDGLKPLIMTLSTFILVVFPGTMVSVYLFRDRFKKAELVIIGFALGMIINPSLIYFINIFEVMHANILGYVVPVIIASVFGWLNFR